MIEVHFDGDDVEVLISGEQAEILDASEDCVLAQCSLPDLATEPSQRLPHELRLQLQSEDGFGTYLFHELAARGETPAAFGRRCIPADCVAPPSNIPDILGRRALSSGRLAALGATLDFHHGLLELYGHPNGTTLAFRCNTPNKYWEGQYGLATFLASIKEQVSHHENWKVADIELEDDWKGITLERVVAKGDPLRASILAAAADLNSLLHAAEIALSGLQWKDEYALNEGLFCHDLLLPLFRCETVRCFAVARGASPCALDVGQTERPSRAHEPVSRRSLAWVVPQVAPKKAASE